MIHIKMTCQLKSSGFIIILLLLGISAKVSNGQNVTSSPGAIQDVVNATSETDGEIDLETLGMFGITAEFAEQFRLNLIKAIEAAREEDGLGPDGMPLRQGEFGGVNGGFYQGGGGGGGGAGGGGGGGQDEDEEEEDEMIATTPGPGAFGVLSGLFGIFSGLGTLSPSRIIQSTVNFFPPGQRMMAQMIVDSLIGYTPPENRTLRPRPRPRRTTVTPTTLPLAEMTMMNATEIVSSKANETDSMIVAKDGETINGTSEVDPMSEVISAPVAVVEPVTTTTEGFLNVHEILNRTTIPPPPQNEDDEMDFEKVEELKEASKQSANSTGSPFGIYKLKPKGTPEEEDNVTLNVTTTALPPASP